MVKPTDTKVRQPIEGFRLVVALNEWAINEWCGHQPELLKRRSDFAGWDQGSCCSTFLLPPARVMKVIGTFAFWNAYLLRKRLQPSQRHPQYSSFHGSHHGGSHLQNEHLINSNQIWLSWEIFATFRVGNIHGRGEGGGGAKGPGKCGIRTEECEKKLGRISIRAQNKNLRHHKCWIWHFS